MTIVRKIVLWAVLVVAGLPLLAIAGVLFMLWYFDASSGSIMSSGEEREYLLHVPAGYDGAEPVPLVISLHVAFMMPASQARYTGWNDVADENGFIVVYPAASGFPKLWQLNPDDGLESDVQFISDLIDTMQSQFNIDASRIYINGYSNGAAMTFLLSCTLGDRVAAFGTVAIPVLDWEWCADTRPVPFIAFQGTADNFVPYQGGTNWLTDIPLQSIPDWAADWGRRNRCQPTARESAVAADVMELRYSACEAGSEFVLYTIIDGGHTWPGVPRMPERSVGKTTTNIHASETMWDFFSSYQLANE